MVRVALFASLLLASLLAFPAATLAQEAAPSREPAPGHTFGGDAVAFGRTVDALVTLVRREYWDPDHLDWQAWADRYRSEAVAALDRPAFDAVMRRMLRALDDDHSSWMGLSAAAPRGGSSAGSDAGPPRLGAQFSFEPGRGLVVERVFAATPAADAGLRRADVIIAVGEVPLGSRSGLIDANAVLAEALASGDVRLVVERRRATLSIDVVGAAVAFREVAEVPFAVMLDHATGYLAVPTFNAAGVGREVHRALGELQDEGAVALVLDLRGNLGGRLAEAGLVVGAFSRGTWADAVARGELAWHARVELLGDGLLSRLERSGGEVLAAARVERPVSWRGPLVVLVDSATVSAGELVALALQDQERALVVGQPTAGNVEAVQGFTLPDGSRVMLAVADLRGPRGLDFSAGVVPDVLARAAGSELARGMDGPLVEARRLLGGLPFTPDRLF